VQDVVVVCPPNTYKWGVACRQCPLNSSSRGESTDKTACHCDENFYLEVPPNPNPETRNPNLFTLNRNPKPETRNPKPLGARGGSCMLLFARPQTQTPSRSTGT
jgi:hypothetical protein